MNALVAAILAVTLAGAGPAEQSASDVDVKAAFLYNFAKFAQWQGLPDGAPIVLCALNDDRTAAALSELTRGQSIETHRLEVRVIGSPAGNACQLLFISNRTPAIGQVLALIAGGSTLTVSDARGFAGTGGMIELFVERERMRFAVDMAAVQRSGVRLSSRMLSLATIVGGDHAK